MPVLWQLGDLGIGERLRDAIEERGMSIRAFQRRLEEHYEGKLPGSSYPAIHRYLSGKVTPPVEFLLAAGDFLFIRPEWLLTGRGEIAADQRREFTEEHLDFEWQADRFPPAVRALLHELVVRYELVRDRDRPRYSIWDDDDRIAESVDEAKRFVKQRDEFTGMVMAFITIPQQPFYGVQGDLDQTARQNFAIAILSALIQLFPAHTHPMPEIEQGTEGADAAPTSEGGLADDNESADG